MSNLKRLVKDNKTKFIFVTGGVLSGLGKGITVASIGNLLSKNHKVVPIKCEGYLNVDPGTMNPVEHGEVFVLEDGEEADMDFGHYERFMSINCKHNWNITMGKVFEKIRERERRGDYLGKTVQFVPHTTNLIKELWLKIAMEEEADIIIVEVGGTVGDIETELHLEAARQLRRDIGFDNVLYIHLTYVPLPSNLKEFKTKPTQQSLILLRERGITPQIILTRSEYSLPDKMIEKIALFSGLQSSEVIQNYDVDSIYEIPLILFKQGLSKLIGEKLNIDITHEIGEWDSLVGRMKKSNGLVRIAICGKYTELEDSYASVVEALRHSGAHNDVFVQISFVETSDIDNIDDAGKRLHGIHGVVIPGGFGSRGVEGKIRIIEYCRKNNIPFLGICYGLQLAVIEYSRNVLGLDDANTTEVEPNTNNPVVDILPEQKSISDKGGTMRRGAYDAVLAKGSIVHSLYKNINVSERHRHRYEVNPEYHDLLKSNGMLLSGMSPDGRLVEFIEVKDHNYFVACQGHIELKSTLLKPAPLFMGFVKAAKMISASESPVLLDD
ncbi:MAG: glutamine hydrolyzing CTP synthase [Candidatus Woesearchaeota archaeon]